MFWVCAGVMLVCLVGIFGQGTPEVVGSILTGAALVWFGGVWYALPVLDMPQARIRGLHSRGRLRKAAILLQLGWALASGAILLQLAFPRSSWLFEPVAHWSVVLAGAGLIMLAILWQRLAEWTRDSDVEKIFFVVMWGLPLAGYILYAHPALVSLTRLLYLVVMVVFLAVPLGLFSLARAMSLCVYHSQEHEARTDRQKERHEKFFQGVIDPYIQATTGEESAED